MTEIPTEIYAFKSEEFIRILKRFKRVSILSHINPDADTIGTALGIYSILTDAEIPCEVVNASRNLPVYLDFLHGYDKIKTGIEFEDSLIVTCDCGSIDRLGMDIEGRTVVNIDHHISNTYYGQLNIVDITATSCSEVALKLMEKSFPVSKAAAESFYTAMISDSRYFTASSVNIDTFRMAEKLIELGAEPVLAAGNLVHRRSLASIKILGLALSSLKLVANGHIAVISLDRKTIDKCGAKPEDMEGIVDYAKSLSSVEIAIMVTEMREYIRVSLRSKKCDIVNYARSYGGGGHIYASGFEIRGSTLKEVESRVVSELGMLVKRIDE